MFKIKFNVFIHVFFLSNIIYQNIYNVIYKIYYNLCLNNLLKSKFSFVCAIQFIFRCTKVVYFRF